MVITYPSLHGLDSSIQAYIPTINNHYLRGWGLYLMHMKIMVETEHCQKRGQVLCARFQEL